jgi:large subunit ribosomal protein L10
MAKTRKQKEEMVGMLTDNAKNAKAVVFANFQGLKVKESEELRKECRGQQIAFVASKKTLLGKAFNAAGLTIETSGFPGSVAAVFGLQDEVVPAQVINKFAKTHKTVEIYGGILEGKFIGADKVVELASLPSKQELLAKLVGSLNAPVSGFVNALAGNLRNLVGVLNNIKETKA